MNALRLLCFLTAAISCAAAQPMADDDISRRLLGVWTSDPAEATAFVTTVTYRQDGTGTELVRLRGESDSTAVRVVTAWVVHGGILTIKSTASSDPSKIPVGVELKDHIISISEDRFIFEAYDGYGATNGKRETRVRKKEPNPALDPTA